MTPGDRYVWTGVGAEPLVLTGEVVVDHGGPMLTVQHDGWTETALVYRDQLAPESS